MRVRVAAAQIRQSNDAKENCERIVEVIVQTEANIICFPETALTGESKPLVSGEIRNFHIRIIDAAVAAKKWVIYGAYSNRGVAVFNEALVVGPNGVVAAYGKRNLWATEEGVSAGLTSPPVIETEFGHIGVLICWDLAFPETVRSLAGRGAKIIFCPSYWYEKYGTAGVIAGLPLVRAFENQVFFVLADACSEETAMASRICSPRQVLSAAGMTERVITAELDLKELERSRAIFNCWPRADG